jgi:hypothetical protein
MNQVADLIETQRYKMNFNCINRYLKLRKMIICKKLSTDNQRGQAVVELSLMMTFLAMILLALIIFYEMGAKNISAIETLRHEMRRSMFQNAENPFTKKMVQTDVFVDIPGKMKQVLGMPFIATHQQIEFYEGSYQGSGDSIYNRRVLYREIFLQN